MVCDVDPVRDAKDLPDLYRYLEALNTAESDLDGPHEPPQLFSQPQHKHSRNNIQLLTYEADEERVQEYVSEFEAAAADEILTVGKISLEEIQVCSMLYTMLYNILYTMLYNILYAMLYNILYTMLYNILYTICYVI